jgi:hypothetical protein
MSEDLASAGLKLQPGSRPATTILSKKPRDNRLRECFTITSEEEHGTVRIACKYCPDYVKILQKFNPTKARNHLTCHCTGVDGALRKTLLGASQAARRTQQSEATSDTMGAKPSALAGASIESTPSITTKNLNDSYRPSPAILSFQADSDNAEVFLVSFEHTSKRMCGTAFLFDSMLYASIYLTRHVLPSLHCRKSLPR